MILVVNPDLRLITEQPLSSQPLSAVTVTRGPSVPIQVQFVRNSQTYDPTFTQTSGTLTIGYWYKITSFVSGDSFTNVGVGSNATGQYFKATGTTPTTWTHATELQRCSSTGVLFGLKWTVKEDRKFDDAPLVLAAGVDFTTIGSGATVSFRAELNYYTEALNALLGVGGTSADDVPEVTLMGEIAWVGPEADKARKIVHLFDNDVNKGDSDVVDSITAPQSIPFVLTSSSAALSGANVLTAGTNVTVTVAGGLVTISAAGGGVWGGITGTLSDQTDLQAALDAKVPTTRTVNGHALSGNVTVSASDVGLGSVENAAASGLYVPLTRTVNGQALSSNISVGTVTTVSVVTANGISGTVANPTTTPAITLTLGVITPTSVNGITFSGTGTLANSGVSSLTAFTGSGTSSGTNTGDQTNISGNAATVTVANEGADTTCFLNFTNSATGSLAIKSSTNATYDALNSRIELTGDASALVVNGSNATLQAKNGVSGGIFINPTTISCTLPALGVTGIRFVDSSGFHNLYVPAADGNFVTTGDTGTVTNAMLAGSIVASTKLSASGTPSSSTFLSGDDTWTAVTVPTAANPTATIDATAVNGSASTFMRSDAAPALPATLPALSGVNLTALTAANITASTTAGRNILNLTNPSAISFVKIAADNTVSTRTPAQVLSDIGAQPAGSYAILGANTFTGVQTFSPTARSSGSAAFLTITTPADTAQTASTESIGVNKTAATRQFATGAITLQREVVFAAPTYSAVGASTITTAVNLDVPDPIAGTNVTITNTFGLRVNSVQVNNKIDSTGNLGIFAGGGSSVLGLAGTFIQSSGGRFLHGSQAGPSASFEAQGAVEHFRARYDGSNYATFTTGSTGLLTIDGAGSAKGVAIAGTTKLGSAGTTLTNLRFGISSAMVLGAVTITDTGATANTRYFFSCAALGTVSIAGTYSPTARSVGASVTCTSSQATETSTIFWLAFEP